MVIFKPWQLYFLKQTLRHMVCTVVWKGDRTYGIGNVPENLDVAVIDLIWNREHGRAKKKNNENKNRTSEMNIHGQNAEILQ